MTVDGSSVILQLSILDLGRHTDAPVVGVWEKSTLYVVMYFVSLFYLLLTVYNTELTIDMNS